MSYRWLFLICAPTVAATAFASSGTGFSTAQSSSQALIQSLPHCQAAALSLALDSENGNFDGMQHSGRLLVIRNVGSTACRLTRWPTVTFIDENNHALPVHRARPVGMHPGPVVTPVGVAAGAELTARLRWVSGDVYADGHCVQASGIHVTAGDIDVGRLPLRARFCGGDQPITFQQDSLAPDPVLSRTPTTGH